MFSNSCFVFVCGIVFDFGRIQSAKAHYQATTKTTIGLQILVEKQHLFFPRHLLSGVAVTLTRRKLSTTPIANLICCHEALKIITIFAIVNMCFSYSCTKLKVCRVFHPNNWAKRISKLLSTSCCKSWVHWCFLLQVDIITSILPTTYFMR